MTLHLVRLPVDLRALAAYAVANGISDDDDGYALHHALRARFGAAGPQPFRFFPEHQRGPHLLGYLGDGEGFEDVAALPVADALLRALFPGPPETQPMPVSWRPGARYGFELRVRPVVRYGARIKAERAGAEDIWWARAGEVDAYVAARTRPEADQDISRETAYGGWLAQRLSQAVDLDAVGLRQFRRVKSRRSTHGKRGAHRVEGPDALMAGTLTVRDPEAFARLLGRGVGRHVAFGFGMLLLSAPGRAG